MGTGTGIGRVRGLGSAKSGAHHWWHQRISAVSNLLLATWFVVSLLRLPSFDYPMVVQWLASPFAAVPMALFVISLFYHLKIGLQVVIEDYVHDDALKVAALILLNFYAIGGGALALFSILKVAVGGAAAG